MTPLITSLSLFVSAIAALIAFLNYKFVHHNRSASHRDALYKKQIETYEKIFSILVPLHYELIGCIPFNPDEMIEIIKPIRAVLKKGGHDELLFEIHKNQFHLDEQFSDLINKYLGYLRQLSLPFGQDYEAQMRSEEEVEKLKANFAQKNKEREEEGFSPIGLDERFLKVTYVKVDARLRSAEIQSDLWKIYNEIVQNARKNLSVNLLQQEIREILSKEKI